MRADSVHVQLASVEVQVQCVNVVISVVLGELLVIVRVVPILLVCDAVVHRTLVLTVINRSHFAVLEAPPVGDRRLPSAVTEF